MVPFPKGYLTDVNQFRITDNAAREISIFSKVLLPWRNMDTLENENNIRSVLVQADIIFPDDGFGMASPVNLILKWGSTRLLPALSETNPRDDWGAC